MEELGLESVITLLQSKKEIFTHYEKLTEELFHYDIEGVEEIENIVEQRTQLATKIDDINASLDKISVSLHEPYPQLSEVLKNRCSYDSLPHELKPVFNAGMEVYAVINRIQNINPTVLTKLEGIRSEMLEQIAASNTTQSANLHRYLNSTGFKGDGVSLLGEKYSKI